MIDYFLKSPYLTTISIELGFLWDFVLLSLKTCSLYHEKLFIQVVNDISTQVFNNFFSASDIMEAVRGHLCFYRYEWMQGCVVQVTIEKLLAYCILHTFSRAVGRGKNMVGQVSSDLYFLEPYINQGADYNQHITGAFYWIFKWNF